MSELRNDPTRRHPGALLCAVLGLALFTVAAPARTSWAQEELATGSWQVTCVADDDCIAYYRTAGLEIYIGKASGTQKMVAEFRLLAESAQDSPVTLRVDNGWIGAMRVETCDEFSCRLAIDIENAPELINQFRLAQDGICAYITDGKIIMIPFGLNGFTTAMNQIGV